MTPLVEVWSSVVGTPSFGIALTLAAYVAAVRLWQRAGRTPFLTPVLVAIVLVVAVLSAAGIDYDTYMAGGRFLSFLLGPATVALAVPLYRSAAAIRRLMLPVLVGVTAGSVAAMVSGILLVRVTGGGEVLEATTAPKSTTTPIAIELAASVGGVPSLAAVLVILTGILSAAAGPAVLRLCRVRDPRIQGLAIGASGHGIGTARALQLGQVQGAFAALAMALTGVVTALLLPLVWRLLS